MFPTILPKRGKSAVCRLTSSFRVASYCRRVDLVCDYHGIGGGGKHCEYNDAQPDRFSHGQRGRDVRYAHTIINAHHVS